MQQTIQRRNYRKNPLYHNITKIKCLGINLTKEVKELYNVNYNTLMKEIEENTNKWKDISYCLMGRIEIGKMSILLKATYGFKAVSVKIPLVFFIETEKQIPETIPKAKAS